MTDVVFPSSLPGFDVKITREPYTDVIINESLTGRELRSTWWTVPRYRYGLSIQGMRTTAAYLELQALMTFFASRFGQYGSFLLQDPDDYTVVAHGFGIGDSATVAFQLQRSLLGSLYDTLGGPWRTHDTPWSNKCLQSQTFGSATWTKTNTGSKTDVMAPDGTLTAAQYTSSGTATIVQTVSGLTASTAYVLSVWARCAAGTTIKLGTTEGNGSAQTLTSTWSRIYLPFTTSGTSTVVTIGAGSSWTTGIAIQFWGAQLETGSTPSPYVATVASAVTTNPYYWPTSGSGFEPVYDPAPGPTIYVDGVAKALTSDYTLGTTGLVTFLSAPTTGQVLTWSGSYYRRVRFDEPGLSAERIVQQLWRSGSIRLKSVLP
jgi:hypothetical protein